MTTTLYKQFPLLAYDFLGVTIGNLLLALLVLGLFMVLKKIFTTIVIGLLQKIASRTKNTLDDDIINAMIAPIGFLFIVAGLYMFVSILGHSSLFVDRLLGSLVVIDFFWIILSIISASKSLIMLASSKFNPDLAKEIGDFAIKIIKVLVISIGFAALLNVWGINVTALVASLGLGGLAFALAAKDTAANLFGSFALLADKSIKIGEWIKVDDIEGVVEDIGMRTTKLRSFEKSLITIPNQMLANTPIENYSRRGIRRIDFTIGLTYDTSQDQIVSIIEQIKQMLANTPAISTDEKVMVNFNSFGDSSLDIYIYCFAKSSIWSEYLDIRQDIYLKIMQIVEDVGSEFAFPSRTLYIQGELPQKP